MMKFTNMNLHINLFGYYLNFHENRKEKFTNYRKNKTIYLISILLKIICWMDNFRKDQKTSNFKHQIETIKKLKNNFM